MLIFKPMLYPVVLYYNATLTTLSPAGLLDRGLWETDEKQKAWNQKGFITVNSIFPISW